MGTLLVNAVLHVDRSGRQCARLALSESEILNAVDSLQRHLSPMGIRVNLTTRRVALEESDKEPARDLVHINGTEIAELLSEDELSNGMDARLLLHAGLAAASDLV